MLNLGEHLTQQKVFREVTNRTLSCLQGALFGIPKPIFIKLVAFVKDTSMLAEDIFELLGQ